MTRPPHDAIATRLRRLPLDPHVAMSDGAWLLTFELPLPRSPEHVWSMLTEPDLLAQWSPIVPDRALTAVGPATARESPQAAAVDVEVLECTAQRSLSHRWGPDTLHWRLDEVEGRTRLRLDHRIANPMRVSANAAGWHLLLCVLDARLAGEDVHRVVGRDARAYDVDGLRDRYAARWSDVDGVS